jgi:hypothetical protein
MKRRIMALTVCVGLAPSAVAAAEPNVVATNGDTPAKLGLFTSLGYLGSPGASGTAFGAGLRLGIGRRFAVSFDVGYGVLGAQSGTVEDRWWLIPSMALVLPTRIAGRRAAFDLGAGVGLGASSGYPSFSTYVAAPFTPEWRFQLVPAARVHAMGSFSVTRGLDILVRADAASLLMSGSGTGLMDTTWLMLSVGAQFRVL